jgi:hypothetical protein
MTSTNELFTPLLGNLPRHEAPAPPREDDEQDEEEYDDKVCMILGGRNSSQEEEFQAENEQSSGAGDESERFFWCSNWTLVLFVSALLFQQFGIAFHMFNVEAVTGLRWSVVKYSIVLYAIVAPLYRASVKDCYDDITMHTVMTDAFYSAIVLLPEILMDTMLGLILFDRVVAAFWLLQFGTLFLAASVVVSSIWLVLVAKRSSSTSAAAATDDDDTTGGPIILNHRKTLCAAQTV